jgi:beta-N-acetylhexosaminidase
LRQGGDAENAREQGRLTGEILRLAGCNMNFAPVLEVFNDERERLNNGLLTRVLGYSPAEVARNAGAFLDGLQSAGILGCAKHFPGIAAGAVDAHDDLPVVNLTQRELLAYDLAPYAEFFRAGAIQTVMVGHAYYPRLSSSPDAISSVLDESIVTGLLRDTMGFRGLVITDDLEMGAITRYGAIEQTAVQAFAAGEDMALICATPEIMQRSYRALLAEARAGNVSEERIKASLTRIAAVKGQLAAPLPFDAARWQALSDEIAALSRKLGFVYGR